MTPPAPGVFVYKIISIVIVQDRVFSALDSYDHCCPCCCLSSCLSSNVTYTGHMSFWTLWLRTLSPSPRQVCDLPRGARRHALEHDPGTVRVRAPLGWPRSECAQGRRDWQEGQGQAGGSMQGGQGFQGLAQGGHGEASWGVKKPLDPPRTWPANH